MVMIDKLHTQLHQAMKSGDTSRKRVVRMLISAIKLFEVAEGTKLTEPDFISLIQKEIKSTNETLSDAIKADRPDIIAECHADLEALETYLPNQPSEIELTAIAWEVISQSSSATNSDASRIVKSCLDAA